MKISVSHEYSDSYNFLKNSSNFFPQKIIKIGTSIASVDPEGEGGSCGEIFKNSNCQSG